MLTVIERNVLCQTDQGNVVQFSPGTEAIVCDGTLDGDVLRCQCTHALLITILLSKLHKCPGV